MPRRGAAALTALALIVVGAVGATQLSAISGPDEPAVERRAIDRVRALFPQTNGWFRIVATARYAPDAAGRLVPDHESLTHERVRWQDASGHTIVPAFAPTFRAATRITSGENPDAWIEVTPASGADVAAEIQDGVVVYPGAYPDTDVLTKSTPTHTDEYLLLWTRVAPTHWRYRVRYGPAIAGLRQGGTAVEAVDARGVPWMRANPPFATDRDGTRVYGVIRVEGDELVAEIDTSELRLPILVDPDWRSTGDMSHGRFYNGGNLLPDGRLMVTGGCSASVCSGDLSLPACRTVVRAAEALDLDTRTWARVGDTNQGAFFHVSQSLEDGSVLVAGGCATSDCSAVTGAAQVFDATELAFRTVERMPEAMAGMASALLPDGRVLVAGGCDATSCVSDTRVFDPRTDAWSEAAPMRRARARATTTVLADGRVLVAGGCTTIDCRGVLDSLEIYDPVADDWREAGRMSERRGGHWAERLLDGRVVIGGGCAQQGCDRVLDSAEIFDPRTEELTAAGTQERPRVGALSVRLPDGSVMLSQGCSSRTDCDLTNEVYDPGDGGFRSIEDAVTVRAFHVLVLHEARDTVIAAGGCQPRTCSWWNETYDVSHLMEPLPDAGPPGVDAGPPPDGGAPGADAGDLDAGRGTAADAGRAGADAGEPGGTVGGGGCACRVTRERAPLAGLALAALLLAALLVRRRRRSRP